MINQDGGNARGDGLSERQFTGRLLQPHFLSPGGGELAIPIPEVLETAEKEGLLAEEPEKKPAHDGFRGSLKGLTPILKTKRFGQKFLHSRGRQRLSSLSKSGSGHGGEGSSRGWLNKFYEDATLFPGSDFLTVFLAFVCLSVLAFFVCLVATKIIVLGCGWSMCMRYHLRHDQARNVSKAQFAVGRADCVFRRFVPDMHFPFLEIIHDVKSRHSVLVEWRNGPRCLLFDMARYVSELDTCPASYPSSLDERLGVPVTRSKLSLDFPRRYARHYFTHLETDLHGLEHLAGSSIAERCSKAQLKAALLVEVRLENRRCKSANQRLVDSALAAFDPRYTPTRSQEVSDDDAEWVVLFESWTGNAKSHRNIERAGVGIDSSVTNAEDHVSSEKSVAKNSGSEVSITSEGESRSMGKSEPNNVIDDHLKDEDLWDTEDSISVFDFIEKFLAKSVVSVKHQAGNVQTQGNGEVAASTSGGRGSIMDGFNNSPLKEIDADIEHFLNELFQDEIKAEKLEAVVDARSPETAALRDLSATELAKSESINKNKLDAAENSRTTLDAVGETEQVKNTKDTSSPSLRDDFEGVTRAVLSVPEEGTRDAVEDVGILTTKSVPRTANEHMSPSQQPRRARTESSDQAEQSEQNAAHVGDSDVLGTAEQTGLVAQLDMWSFPEGGADTRELTHAGPSVAGSQGALNNLLVLADSTGSTHETNVVRDDIGSKSQKDVVRDDNGSKSQNVPVTPAKQFGEREKDETATRTVSKPEIRRESSVRGISLLNLIHSSPGMNAESGDKDNRFEVASILNGWPAQAETRRYYLWRGRIVRVCQIPGMP